VKPDARIDECAAVLAAVVGERLRHD